MSGLPCPASSRSSASSLRARSFAAASPKAPTPGRMMRSAVRSASSSRVTVHAAPICLSEQVRE